MIKVEEYGGIKHYYTHKKDCQIHGKVNVTEFKLFKFQQNL